MPALTIPHTIGTSAIIGQGSKPLLWALMSFSDAQTDPPVWVDVTHRVRSFDTSRGRENELAEIDAGTATVVLDNQDRALDPTYTSSPYYPNVRPMNRIKLYEQFGSLTNPIFTGYVEAIDLEWPDAGMSDALAVIHAADEFKALTQDALPMMNPPITLIPIEDPDHKGRNRLFEIRDFQSYNEVVAYDAPTGYWQMDDDPAARTAAGSPGPALPWFSTGGTLVGVASMIVGEWVDSARGALGMDNAGFFAVEVADGGAGDVGSLQSFTFETWFLFNGNPSGADRSIANTGTSGSPGNRWNLELTTSGTLRFSCTNSGSTTTSCTTAALTPNTIYHIVATYTGSAIAIYLNGVSAAANFHSGAFATFAGTEVFELGPNEAPSDWQYDSVAFYRFGLSTARIGDHYTAGSARGFNSVSTGQRMGRVLDTIVSHAPRSLQTGVRGVIRAFMRGQDPLSEMKAARVAENVDAMLFISRSGAVTFLAADHRSVSPHNTVQAVFSDKGTGGTLPYLTLNLDYSDAGLYNEFIATRPGVTATPQTASNVASISDFGKRSQSLAPPVVDDGDALDIVTDLLAKYKDPLLRATTITLDTSDTAVMDNIFQRELGDRIRVIKAHPGGLGDFDQILFIQKIAVSGDNTQAPWRVTFSVSPV